MSLFESGDSTGDVSLKELCNNNLKQKLTGEVNLRHIAGLIIRGGWPGNLDYSPKDSSEAIKAYIDLIIDDDLIRLDGINRDKHKVKLLLKSLARNETTTVSNKKLKEDIKEIDNEDIDIDTLASYLNALDKLYLLDKENKKFQYKLIKSGARAYEYETAINWLNASGIIIQCGLIPYY